MSTSRVRIDEEIKPCGIETEKVYDDQGNFLYYRPILPLPSITALYHATTKEFKVKPVRRYRCRAIKKAKCIGGGRHG